MTSYRFFHPCLQWLFLWVVDIPTHVPGFTVVQGFAFQSNLDSTVRMLFPASTHPLRAIRLPDEENKDSGSLSAPPEFSGPTLDPNIDIVAGASLAELGLDICTAPSSVAGQQLGLYCRIADEVEGVTVPALTLLSGYSRLGTFEATDEGDKTVGFQLFNPNTAVFFERQLMSIVAALQLAAQQSKGGACGLVGHELQVLEDESIEIKPVNDGFERYFVPELVNRGSPPQEEDYNIQNFGQFCNDLAWDYSNPPLNEKEYIAKSDKLNMIQLVWRMEFVAEGNYLKPTWPVSVFQRDVTFTNRDFMEMGTRYGWNYWQASVDLSNM